MFVLLWGANTVKTHLNRASFAFAWPALHDQILRMPPVVPQPSPSPARFDFNWLATPGTACLLAALLAAIFVPRILLARFIALVVLFYAYVGPKWAP